MVETVARGSARNPIDGVVYPPADMLRRYRDAGILGDRTLGAALHDVAVRHADRIALITPQVRLTYRELDVVTDKVAAALVRLGLRPLDRAIMQVGNVAAFFYITYGCFKAGVVPVCTLPAHRESEIGFLAPFTDAKIHFVQEGGKFDLAAFALDMQAKTGVDHIVTTGTAGRPGVLALDALIAREDAAEARRTVEAFDVDAWNVGVFQLSGGTTGLPKVIPRFHNDYLYNAEAFRDWAGYDAGAIAYWPLPAAHNAAMIAFNLPVHLAGGAVCVQEAVDPELFLGLIAREKVNVTGAVLPIIVRAVEYLRDHRPDLSSVKTFISTAESPLVERELKVPGYHIFGMAEGLCMLTRPQDPETVRQGMIGRPISCFDEVRLVQPGTNDPVAEGEDGEFLCRGPYTLRGYFKAPEHNAKIFTDDGFYRSGDLMRAVRIGDALYYKFLGRLKDNIDRGAEKISAEEIETFVGRHPAVESVAAIGMPDPTYGERVCVYIIAKPGMVVPTVEQLGAFLGVQGLAKFKWPERIEVVENFPVTKVGKVSKGLLRGDIATKLQQEKLRKAG